MRKPVRRALGAAALVAVVGVPGVAFAGTTEVAADPQPSVEDPGPPSWAPEECQEMWDSPEMQAWREEHRAEMQEHHEQQGAGGMHRHGAGDGPRAGHMWDGA
ncbi:hypothetical protein [Georgenia sp. SUBG003]|uniref:hypothetical protein n=1 Tax=Georgenia sp. SUBG003 TaxID=1497974 RepID=UPI003AB73E50